MAGSALSLALLSALLLCAHATFSKFNIPGTYTMMHGANSCPPQVRIGRLAMLNFNTSTAVYSCANGFVPKMDISEVPGEPSNPLSVHLRAAKEVGQFTVAQVAKNISCTNNLRSVFTIKAPVIVNFFRSSKTVMFNFSKIFENATKADGTHSTPGTPHSSVRFVVRQGTEGHSSATPGQSPEPSVNSATGGGHSTPTEGAPNPNEAAHSGPHSSAPSTSALSIGLAANKPDYLIERNVRYMSIGADCLYKKTSGPACFPGSATVRLASGAVARMHELRIGDRVQTGPRHFSPVFLWTHRDAAVVGTFVRLRTASGHALTLSPGHFVYADGVALPAARVRVGAALRLGSGRVSHVVRVTEVAAQGLYNPHTLQGDIVVDGVVASTYTTAVEPGAAHALLAPVRYAYAALAAAVGGIARDMGSAAAEL